MNNTSLGQKQHWLDCIVNICMYRWMYRWMDGWLDEWMDGWMDE